MALPTTEDLAFNFAMASDHSSSDEGTAAASPFVATPPDAGPSECNDIAVIGYACRLWDFLMKKGDACGEMPAERWAPWRHRQPGIADTLDQTTSKGYFINDIKGFDAQFFGISGREAEQMDPQQRISLEVACEALEHAGIPLQSLAGSDAAVIMGVNSDDYSRLILEDLQSIDAYMGIGTAYCGIPNRISHALDLAGPTYAVDGACASSLVAIHQARRALLAGETSLAIAGGVNAHISPYLTRVLDIAGAVSPEGRCRSFDDSASGYGRGEGAGIVVLKRLSDAVRDGDRVLAVLKGSAVGSDGKTVGIMAPNQLAQEQVARDALKEARLSAGAVGYIEAHATSTPVGDRTECAAMASVYGSARLPGSPDCFVGSIKPNIGHLEAGAGVMGFIKAVMAVEKGVIPPQANLTNLSTKIDWKAARIRPVTEPTAWATTRMRRTAAVASYGYGGTVAHAIIQEAPSYTSLRELIADKLPSGQPTILLLSAPQDERIRKQASTLADWLQQQPDELDMDSVAWTLAVKRSQHRRRAAIVAESKAQAVELLSAMARGVRHPQTVAARASDSNKTNGAVWVFSGHGAQWKGMGRVLLETNGAFADVVKQLERVVQDEMGFSVTEALLAGDCDETATAQVLTYVMHIGIAAVLREKGARPRACLGHSLGEVAAAVVAGALTATEGAVVCCRRAVLYRRVAGAGAMALVNLPASEVEKEINRGENGGGDVVVAIHSSPESCVIAGTADGVAAVTALWDARGVRAKKVKTDVAFHSPVLEQLVEPLRAALGEDLRPKEPQIALYSTSLDDPRAPDARGADYWIGNMVKPVQLTKAIGAAASDGFRLFVEVSAHPIIAHSIQETLDAGEVADAAVIPTGMRDKDDRKTMLLALAKLHCAGDVIAFKEGLLGRWNHEVPGTAWQHQPFWPKMEKPRHPVGHDRSVDVKGHRLLGAKTSINGTNVTLWQAYLHAGAKPFPGSHPLHGSEIVPAAVLLNTFLSLAPTQSLRSVGLRVPVVVEPPREVQVLLDNGQMAISSRLAAGADEENNHSWLTNTVAGVGPADAASKVGQTIDLADVRKRLPETLPPSFSIDYLANVGVAAMGFPWQVVEHVRNDDEFLAVVDADPQTTGASAHWGGQSWASVLDAMTSVSSTVFWKQPLLRMPTAVDAVTLLPGAVAPKTSYMYVRRRAHDAHEFAADVLVCDEQGTVLVDVEKLAFAGIEGNADSSSTNTHSGLVHRVAWPPAQLAEEPRQFDEVVFLAPESAAATVQAWSAELGRQAVRVRLEPEPDAAARSAGPRSAVVVVAETARAADDVAAVSLRNCERLAAAVQRLWHARAATTLFCLTRAAHGGSDPAALSQAALIGLARIVHSEHPELFGGLVDTEHAAAAFPLQALKYVRGADVTRIEDGVARCARLRPLLPGASSASAGPVRLAPHATYLITGGLGALGLETARWMVERGATRIALVSRRALPPRRAWGAAEGADAAAVRSIVELEARGASIHAVAVDMGAADAPALLQRALDALALPPVRGVVHAAGTLANETVAELTTAALGAVAHPKVAGALNLHHLYPPGTLDFAVWYSSCGQLLGFPGQAAYAAANAFLDALAAHRRRMGDACCVSVQWSSWRGLGMSTSTRYIDAELEARGITDVTRAEALFALELLLRADVDHAAVLRARPLAAGDPLPHPILRDSVTYLAEPAALSAVPPTTAAPKSLKERVTECVAAVLSLSVDSIDEHTALVELGMDSVMTVGLRSRLQKLGLTVGPTLLWNCPTVAHLVAHFEKEGC
ncbi:6-methylsalicylic acid synthase [Macrophomina phaseolina]|uniref:6-methylsalicylic acid synthase n=1 Tax=Macrophomina phaseolina TaxID=35725 RepID=A0ABQ8FS30_9PEZI|nr:6-methylsalicylic acid synthase [Macrophomina phaseolina]